jgi:hypothetical protein
MLQIVLYGAVVLFGALWLMRRSTNSKKAKTR